MGLDLTLIPIGHDSSEWGFGHELINLERDYELFDKLQKLPTSAVPSYFATFRACGADGEVRYGDTQSTPYGEPLRAVTMAQLKAMQIEGAAGAFIAASPDGERVALFWH